MAAPSSEKNGKPDIMLLFVTLILVSVGMVMIYSASFIIAQDRFGDEYHFLKKQILFGLAGLILMITLSNFPYHMWKKLAYPGILVSFILLFLLIIPGFGAKVGGATRWLKAGPVTFQVSEAVKIAVVIFMAYYMTKKADHVKEFFRIAFIPLSITSIVVALILMQPDFGTAVIILAVVMCMYFIAGGRIIHLTALLAAAFPLAFALVVRESYRLERLMAFRNPWKDPSDTGFQIIQSFISFGSGGTFGVGLGNSMQKLFYLPEPHTDFILSVIAEEGGFVGVAIVISLFTILIIRGFWISFRAPEAFGMLLAAGLTVLLALEGFINMAAVMGLIPTKGLALPFLSYGGTSLIVSMAAVGILLNISTYEAGSQGTN
ncbi:MAG: putative lipid II flippase FtsW [Syntrophales bacterium]|jgi:cell division protein FtsW|nr:putative lipid II flippase FtsW [Syntrophales bacterium]MDY0043056.1 putative lipid II flippase FtsW [Syntrophales bacterium]